LLKVGGKGVAGGAGFFDIFMCTEQLGGEQRNIG
jgi:hypothetical protein